MTKSIKKKDKIPVGRPKYKVTIKDKNQVEALSGYGINHDEISYLIGVDKKTLYKYYREELNIGKAKANAKVGQSLYNKCTVDKDTSSIIWWTKTQMGFSEVQKVESTNINQNINIETSEDKFAEIITAANKKLKENESEEPKQQSDN